MSAIFCPPHGLLLRELKETPGVEPVQALVKSLAALAIMEHWSI